METPFGLDGTRLEQNAQASLSKAYISMLALRSVEITGRHILKVND